MEGKRIEGGRSVKWNILSGVLLFTFIMGNTLMGDLQDVPPLGAAAYLAGVAVILLSIAVLSKIQDGGKNDETPWLRRMNFLMAATGTICVMFMTALNVLD